MEPSVELEDIFARFEQLSVQETPRGRRVALIHEAGMQAHSPHETVSFMELPKRTVAIESVLRGYAFDAVAWPAPIVQLSDIADARRYAWGDSTPTKEPRTVASRAKTLAKSLTLEQLLEELERVHADRLPWTAAQFGDAKPGSVWSRCQIRTAPMASLDWVRPPLCISFISV